MSSFGLKASQMTLTPRPRGNGAHLTIMTAAGGIVRLSLFVLGWIWWITSRQKTPRSRLNINKFFPGVGISIIKIRQSSDRLIFIMGILILVRRHIYIETGPWYNPQRRTLVPFCKMASNLKSPEIWLFAQQLVKLKQQRNYQSFAWLSHCEGNSPLSSRRASNTENMSLLSWRNCGNRPEVRKLLLFYFFFFSTWSWKIIPYLLFYFFSNRS